jgi:hypothetical protein
MKLYSSCSEKLAQVSKISISILMWQLLGMTFENVNIFMSAMYSLKISL